jgi:DNA-binding MarR family transcriptional regulator
MGFRAAPFDVVEASRRVWLERWDAESASGMAVYTAILRSYQLLNDQVNKVMRTHDLTFARYEVLAWLATDPESSLTLSWISKTLRIPPATVTNIIDRLEADGLVRRVPHPSDARTTLAEITARGRRLADAATRDLNSTVYGSIGLSPRKRSELVDLLAELRANGNEFDVKRSDDVIEELAARRGRGRRYRTSSRSTDVWTKPAPR